MFYYVCLYILLERVKLGKWLISTSSLPKTVSIWKSFLYETLYLIVPGQVYTVCAGVHILATSLGLSGSASTLPASIPYS